MNKKEKQANDYTEKVVGVFDESQVVAAYLKGFEDAIGECRDVIDNEYIAETDTYTTERMLLRLLKLRLMLVGMENVEG